MRRASRGLLSFGLALLALLALALPAWADGSAADKRCDKPVYLTFDTGHMGVAEQIADVLRRQQVRVTFFAADEPTQVGDGSLGAHWSAWWRARGDEGHEFASHTLDHVYWRADLPQADGSVKFRMRASAGAQANREQTWTAAQYCSALKAASTRLQQRTGRTPLPLFRAPGGKTSPALLAAARQCGYLHVGWAPAGFLGDELPSDKYPNEALLNKALRDIRPGDVMMAHLGIWSRKDPWAPAVLEPLIVGLKQAGFCFRSLREHPDYQAWIAQHAQAGK